MLDRPVVVLDDGLPSFVEVFFLLQVPFVGIDEVLMLRPFNDPTSSTVVFGAAVQYRAPFTVFCFEVLHPHGACVFAGRTSPVFVVPGSVGGQY